ncbi:MAG: hypothetical protein [Cressdnaviricota sp.]|nr:MAG: hypothetical protein [Cressdnaviricota sp.]
MAKRKYNQKARALQPAVMKLHFVANENLQSAYVDISECVSRLNRRFYRQGLNWAVANVKLTTLPALSTAAGSTSYVNTIPHTWSVANAWMKAFHAWKDQQDEAMASSGSESAIAVFRDFKVFADEDHFSGTKLSPVSVGPGNAVGPFLSGLIDGLSVDAAENWEYSQVVFPNDGGSGITTEFFLKMVGPSDSNAKGIINGYEFSRSFPHSPDPATPAINTSWFSAMHDVGQDQDEIVLNAVDRNDNLPYDQNEYPGGGSNFIQLECQGYNLNQSSVGLNTWNTGPFTAPCGLIRFDFMNQTSEGGSNPKNFITIELVPGTHRGYLCETMEEF